MENMNWIKERFQEFNDSEALIADGKTYLYSDILVHVGEWEEKIRCDHIVTKEVVALYGDFCADMLFAMIALILNKNIVVPISKEKHENLEAMLQVSQVNQMYRFEKDDISLEKFDHTQTHELIEKLRVEDDAGIMIFTSGSTGEGKCALHKFSNMVYRVSKKVTRKALRSLIFLKMDHIGGINTIFSILFQGGTMILIQDRSIKTVCSYIEKYQVELLPTTPSFINMMMISGAHKEYDLSSLRLITYGTEPMLASTLEALHQELPNVKIRQTYGLTEAGIFPTKSLNSESTWMKIGDGEIKTKVVDHLLLIHSPYAMLGYLNSPNPFDEEGWYNTGDEVEVNGDYYHILGRKEELINVAGEKVFPAEIEDVLLRISNVEDVVVRGKRSPVTGQIVTADFRLINEEDPKAFKKRVIEYCKKELEDYKIPRLIRIMDNDFISVNLKKKRL